MLIQFLRCCRTLYNSNGNLHARYEYDAWGKLLSIKNANGVDITNNGNFAIVNPFRYREYYYDTESGLYYLQSRYYDYLQSRYYDPTTGRFVNADVIAYSTIDSFVGMNLYAYAKNNYISCIDSNGYFVITLFTLATVAVATVATVATATVVITVVNSPSFQRDLNNLINQIRTRISSLLRPVSISKGKSISKTWFGHIPLYYGADIRGGTWKKVTGAMTLSQAVAWVKTTASKKVYGKNASWGVYTRS